MKSFVRPLLLVALVCLMTSLARAADSNWAGEFTDKNFLKGQGVFQLSIEQSGSAIQVSFDAAHNDGSGAAPEGQGPAKITGKNSLAFTFKDSFDNSGTGTITRAGDDIIVSINPTHVAEARCLVFYRKDMRLKRSGKK